MFLQSITPQIDANMYFPKYIKVKELEMSLRKACTSDNFGNHLRWEYYCPKWCFCLFALIQDDKIIMQAPNPVAGEFTGIEAENSTKENFELYNKYYLWEFCLAYKTRTLIKLRGTK